MGTLWHWMPADEPGRYVAETTRGALTITLAAKREPAGWRVVGFARDLTRGVALGTGTSVPLFREKFAATQWALLELRGAAVDAGYEWAGHGGWCFKGVLARTE